jgi:putative aldouronate transport system substrate-binding protein
MFVPYTDHFNLAPNLKKAVEDHPDIMKMISAENGKLYIMPRLTLNTITEGYLAREDLLLEAGLSQPKDFEDLYKILKTFREKYPDMAVFVNRNGTEHIVNRLAYSWGSGYEPSIYGFYLDRTKDQYAYGPVDPGFRDMVVWLKKLYDEKIFDRDYALMTTAQWQEAWANERAAFTIDYVARVEMVNQGYINKGSAARIVALSTPAGPTGQKGMFAKSPTMPNSGIVVSSKTANRDAAIRFVDWIFSDYGRYVALYGIEGETFTIDTDGRPVLSPR